MATLGRKPISLRSDGKASKLIKKNYYLDERYTKALTAILDERAKSSLSC